MCDKFLKSAVWNIEGLSSDKMIDSHFIHSVQKLHIVSFVETWLNDLDHRTNIPGFCLIDKTTRKKHKNARRNSGGISVFAKNTIAKGIKQLPKNHPDILWIKLDHSFFKISRDIFIATIYISPENSKYYTDGIESVYERLLADTVKYSNLGHVMVQGDFNGYTNTKPDYITFDDNSNIDQEDDQYVADSISPRNNLDRKLINNSGRLLLNLCQESGLRILNGRTIGDLSGKFTCITYNGCSVVDYMLVSNDLLNIIGDFIVHDFTSLSNHCMISCSLLTNFHVKNNNHSQLDPLPNKFIWTKEAVELYTQNINSADSKQKLEHFLQTEFTDTNSAVEAFTSILQENAKKSAKFVKKIPNNSRKKNRNKKRWFSETCKDLRVTVKNYEKLVNRFPENDEYRKKFYSLRSKFRRLCKYEERAYKNKICSELSNTCDKDPKIFWDIINKLGRQSNGQITDNDIPQDDFIAFFKNLNKSEKEYSSKQCSIVKEFEKFKENINNSSVTSELDKVITMDEIIKAIQLLRNGKSASSDLVSNEMLKNGQSAIIKPLYKLFNFIFSSGSFPRSWNESFIVLLHKKGNRFDPSNYRGISISSNLGKLFNKIIYNRLLNFMNNKNLISKNQIGFKEKCRTSDHIFTLKSIIDHYKLKHQKVFTAFIDLRKAFDTVWRIGLFYKLLKQDIPNRIFRVVYSMYTDTMCRIKFTNGLSVPFISERGVKQGDVLSPLLFNYFIDDLTQKLNGDIYDPVVIGNTTVSILLYADDIVLLSQSREGLQNCLNTMYDYCSLWKLHVNADKSKVIVFNSNGKTFLNQFKYDKLYLETVSHYSYLGIVMKCNGNFNLAINTLMEKARKAYFKIKKLVGLNNPCKLLEKLFDTLISPILTYCSEIWGVFSNLKDSEPFEKLHLKFMKEILGVHCKASNDACRAELGRLPLKSRILFSCVKFLEHILHLDGSLVKDIFQATNQSNPWIIKIKVILQNLGFPFLIHNMTLLKPYLQQIKLRISDQNVQSQNALINESSKLTFFRSVYTMGYRPPYIDILKNVKDRAAICKIRISAHNLMIEKGRYLNIPKTDRNCPICNVGQIENEEHFLLHCKEYTSKRLVMLSKINKKISSNCETNKIVNLLINSSSEFCLKLTSSYIIECLEIRNNIMS